MTIKEFSSITGISAYTLRYYEKKGLLQVKRSLNGRRNYSVNDVEWVTFLKRLKDTGMLLREIKKYSDLRYQGDETMEERMELLIHHRKSVLKEQKKWEECLENLDVKIEIYREQIEKKKAKK